MSFFIQYRKSIALSIALVFLVVGSVQLFVPSENAIEPINTIVELADHEIDDTRNSLWAVWAVTRLVNAGISLLQEKEISLVAISGQPFKVLEPLDDTIERMSDMLFYLAIFSTILSFVFEPMVTFGFIIGGAGLIGIWMNSSFKRFGSLIWPNQLVIVGGYLLSFPILFFLVMQLFHLATDHRIENAHKRFNLLTQTEELSQMKTDMDASSFSNSHQIEVMQGNEDEAIIEEEETTNPSPEDESELEGNETSTDTEPLVLPESENPEADYRGSVQESGSETSSNGSLNKAVSSSGSETDAEESEDSDKPNSIEESESEVNGWLDWMPGFGESGTESRNQTDSDRDSDKIPVDAMKNSTDDGKDDEEVQDDAENSESSWFGWIPEIDIFPDSVTVIAGQAKMYFTDSIDLMQKMFAIVANTQSIIETGIELMALYFIKLAIFPVILMFGSFLIFRVVYKRSMRSVIARAKESVENVMAP